MAESSWRSLKAMHAPTLLSRTLGQNDLADHVGEMIERAVHYGDPAPTASVEEVGWGNVAHLVLEHRLHLGRQFRRVLGLVEIAVSGFVIDDGPDQRDCGGSVRARGEDVRVPH
eukprot:CAMPEP_0119092988 /NCGR_PEP_ID=MMETSP1178-20130426/161659_1 /TAXON_ID=33656 /ORGANISM="unid sp, Strain CCMP2000" /LENGTH=113 /DNA_ID=CAMNT_0007076613 /DNA_START=35 /DNA_END=377 /DNA_ORIENTATION=-